MKRRIVIVACCVAAAAGCDRSITHGADGSRDWDHRLAAAVPIGISADTALAVMTRNGFRCTAGADSVRYLWCDKWSGTRLDLVRRRWQAVLNIDAGGRIVERRASTDLTGP